MATTLLKIEYEFRLGNGQLKRFEVQLQKRTLALVRPQPQDPPPWTWLRYHQCPNCPLQPKLHRFCPVALGLMDVIEAFKDCLSTEPAEITIRTEQREYRKQASVQYGVSSLMGLHMVSSGCPHLDKFRPMVHTHLPFGTLEETMFRLVAMYLLAQFYRDSNGQKPDWTLAELVQICEQVGKVNQAFARRLISINPQDASLNGLANLDCFSTITAFSIVQDSLKELQPLFHAYLEGIPDPEPGEGV